MEASEIAQLLTRHEMLVQLVRAREPDLLVSSSEYARQGEYQRVLNAEAVAMLIEEVLALVDHR